MECLQLGTDGTDLTDISLEENKLTLHGLKRHKGNFRELVRVCEQNTFIYMTFITYEDIYISYC